MVGKEQAFSKMQKSEMDFMSERLEYVWPEGKRCAAAFSVDLDGESPFLWRTRNESIPVLGELEQRAFGPRQGVYRILDMLKRLDIRSTFFIPGIIAERYPQVVEAIAADGHEIGLHGYLHENVKDLSENEIEQMVIKGKEALENIIGKQEFGFRSPSWEMTPETLRVLKRHGIRYDSSLMGYDHPYWIDGLPEVPVQWLLDDAIYFRFFGGYAGPPPANPKVVTDTWWQEFEGLKRYGGLFLLTVHSWLSGRGSRIIALEELLTGIREDSEVWWATCGEIADYHRQQASGAFHVTTGE